MLTTRLTAAALAAALAIVPAERAAADGKDFIAGAVIGGLVGSQLQKQKQRNDAATTASRSQPSATYSNRQYRSSIPSTEEGRRIQASLNFFGFNAGPEDGQIGQGTRNAIAQYQGYMGYPITGDLTMFEQDLLTSSYYRAQAGGNATYSQIAAQPDGTRGLLKVYREEIANGTIQQQTLTGSSGG